VDVVGGRIQRKYACLSLLVVGVTMLIVNSQHEVCAVWRHSLLPKE
jgi:hypothetical protein